ncbi:methyltransferase domain-containing protein [Deinococcus sp. QL22]|uniref:methyltransferase domain-containing protein n=1 Tax=Deinococcus sp. QL22 TaxID=2939437 RepID=UPI002017A55F|nr:methyltransferase domain-containing protein [Deinococcus sp. QL22]UQN09980.1 methyltransferase domain-containing protein [Deinococcus sp. QL22]
MPTQCPHLPAHAFRRVDETGDEAFYAQPRFVTHIDDGAIAAVTDLYRQYFPAQGAVLDLMSSWVSHLPPEVEYGWIEGLGMNRQELAANPRLTGFTVQNLNENHQLPYESATFDGCGICVSIDYLTQPIKVLREVARVLKPGAPIVITFSNRCFPTKAVQIWHSLDDAGHLALVADFLRQAGGFAGVQMLDCSPTQRRRGDPLFAVVASATGEVEGAGSEPL